MMRSPRRSTVGVAIGLVAVGVLAGCGRADTATTPQATSAAVDDSPATGEVQIWAFNAEGEALAALAEKFEGQNPDVDVVVTPVPNDELPRKVEAAIAAGNVPDIVQPSTALPSYVATGGIAPVPYGLVEAGDYFSSAVDSVTIDDVLYGVPWYVNVQTFFYDADAAAAAGAEAPTTWDELADFGVSLSENGAAQGLWTASDPVNSWQALLTYIYQAGGQVLEDGEFTLDTPEVVEAIEFYASLYETGASNATYQPELGAAIGEFAGGSLGSLTNGSFLYDYLVDAAGSAESVGATALPAGPASNASYLGGSGLSVFADAPNADAAWKFIRFLSEPENQQEFYDAGGVLPATIAAWESGEFADEPVFQAFREQLEASIAVPTITTWTQVRTAISAVAEQVARGTLAPADAATRLQAEAEAIGTGD